MKFTFADTRARYRATLNKMRPEKVAALGESWDKAALGFYFGSDDGLCDISVRDTLGPMLQEDGRGMEGTTLVALFDFTSPDKVVSVVAQQIHRAYLISPPGR